MARVIMPLCAERHYMGSTSNGRFSTDRSLRPDYDRRPSAQTRARWAANHDANLTRYLRDQHVVGLVLACQDARDNLSAGQARLAELDAALNEARTSGDAVREAKLAEAQAWLRDHLDDTLQTRRRASQQLRLIGISPKQEALIRAEIAARSEARTARLSA